MTLKIATILRIERMKKYWAIKTGASILREKHQEKPQKKEILPYVGGNEVLKIMP